MNHCRDCTHLNLVALARKRTADRRKCAVADEHARISARAFPAARARRLGEMSPLVFEHEVLVRLHGADDAGRAARDLKDKLAGPIGIRNGGKMRRFDGHAHARPFLVERSREKALPFLTIRLLRRELPVHRLVGKSCERGNEQGCDEALMKFHAHGVAVRCTLFNTNKAGS